MIEIIQGTPGSGKSAVSLVMGLSHLVDGGALACNFDLVPDWAWLLAGLNFRVRMGFADQLQRANSLRQRCFRIGSSKTIFDLSEQLKTCGLSDKWKNSREGKGLLILDEAQLVFNSRDFQKNMPWIEFFTQHRKLGWNIILIAHHIHMIDKQIRPLVEIETRFRNLKNVNFPILPIPVSPFNLFLGVRFYSGNGPGSGLVHGRFLQFLDLRLARLYDTLHVFAFDDVQTTIALQGRNPAISRELLGDRNPDFFLPQKFSVPIQKIVRPPRTDPDQPVRKKKAILEPSRSIPGQVRHFY